MFFYDNDCKRIIRLLRKLTKIRRSGAQFSDGQHFFYNDYNNFNSKGWLSFSRQLGNTFILVVVNFTNQEQTTSFASFPTSGDYVEEIEGGQNLNGVVAGGGEEVKGPDNNGRLL